MQRIDTPTRAESLFGDGKHGFKAGNPATGEQATALDAGWFNRVQESIMHPIEAAGLTPEAGDHGQLTEAIRRLSASAPVRRPINAAPANGATGVGGAPTLTGSPYYSLYGVAQAARRFQIATDAGFTALLLDITVPAPVVSCIVPFGTLQVSMLHYWRVWDQDADGEWSAASEASTFMTAATFVTVSTPTMTGPAVGTSVGVTPTLTSGAFAATGGPETHAASRWRIATAADPASVIHDSGPNATALTSYTVPSGVLSIGLTYYAQVLHVGTLGGASAWSPWLSFTTIAAFGEQLFLTPGSFVFTVPPDVYEVHATGVGGGGGGSDAGGGGGGGLRWKNNISVDPGQKIQVTVGAGGAFKVAGGSTSFGTHFTAYGGQAGNGLTGGAGGDGLGGSGGKGGRGGNGKLFSTTYHGAGGGGAAGYDGDGGRGGDVTGTDYNNTGERGFAGTGGGASGGGCVGSGGPGWGGGGVGLYGKGASGASGFLNGQAGSGGNNASYELNGPGGVCGGGAGGYNWGSSKGADGGLRVSWGVGSEIVVGQ